jgi:hypothetical protein
MYKEAAIASWFPLPERRRRGKVNSNWPIKEAMKKDTGGKSASYSAMSLSAGAGFFMMMVILTFKAFIASIAFLESRMVKISDNQVQALVSV